MHPNAATMATERSQSFVYRQAARHDPVHRNPKTGTTASMIAASPVSLR